MKHVTFIAFLLLFSIWLISPVYAQDPIFYPAKGQSEDQLEKDNTNVTTGPRKKPVSIR